MRGRSSISAMLHLLPYLPPLLRIPLATIIWDEPAELSAHSRVTHVQLPGQALMFLKGPG